MTQLNTAVHCQCCYETASPLAELDVGHCNSVVCLSVGHDHERAKTEEPFEVPFWDIYKRNRVLDGRRVCVHVFVCRVR